MNTQKTKQELFLDYFNNFLSVQYFAEHYGFELGQAQEIINQGRILHEDHVKSLYPKKTMTGPFKVSIVQSQHEKELPDVYLSNEQGFHLCKVYNSEMQFIPDGEKLQAEHIAKCVNLHDELVDGMDRLLLEFKLNTPIDKTINKNDIIINYFEDLIKRAKGEV